MASYRTTRFIQVTFLLLVTALVIGALVYIGRMVFFPTPTSTSQVDNSETALISTSADRAVRLTVRGPIVADEDFRTYAIQITPNERVLTLSKGYLNQQFDNITLGNNIPAYEQFVYALNRAGMMSGSQLTGDNNDTRGICATGKLYEFEVLKADKTVKMLWTTTCSGASGSETASASVLRELFTDQIPGASIKIGRL
jgi:hypothetical protein